MVYTPYIALVCSYIIYCIEFKHFEWTITPTYWLDQWIHCFPYICRYFLLSLSLSISFSRFLSSSLSTGVNQRFGTCCTLFRLLVNTGVFQHRLRSHHLAARLIEFALWLTLTCTYHLLHLLLLLRHRYENVRNIFVEYIYIYIFVFVVIFSN